MDLHKVLDGLSKNAIRLEFKMDNKEEIPIGSSKFGGKPDLPKGFEWFYFSGEDTDGVTKERPLNFLAQINCAEIRQYDKDGLLPLKGILYFFYDLAAMTWGFDPKDKGSARVYYFDVDVSELARTNFPHDMEDEFKLPEIKLGFSKKYDLPDYEEFREFYEYENWEHYNEVKAMKGHGYEETVSKLLGYADLAQGEMLLDCELVTNGIYTGYPPDITDEELEKFKENRDQWQLLFQLDSLTTDDFELMFADAGRIYYYIKKDDLEKRNFDDCWLILQC